MIISAPVMYDEASLARKTYACEIVNKSHSNSCTNSLTPFSSAASANLPPGTISYHLSLHSLGSSLITVKLSSSVNCQRASIVGLLSVAMNPGEMQFTLANSVHSRSLTSVHENRAVSISALRTHQRQETSPNAPRPLSRRCTAPASEAHSPESPRPTP